MACYKEKTPVLGLYKSLMRASTPLLESYLRRRTLLGKEDPLRAGERRGVASLPRPSGALVWCHAASVGESISLLALVTRLLDERPDLHILLTTGTVTSANLMAQRLPPRAFHQYVPVDHPAWVASFLDHWRPDLVLWSESELWPNMLAGVAERHIPAALLNARMSEKTFSRWKRARATSRQLLSVFGQCLAQNGAEAARLEALGARNVAVAGNLKYAALPLPADETALSALRLAVGARPLLLWASTHPGEEEMAGRLHAKLATARPDMLTVIVPRHPKRGADIEKILAPASVMLRSAGGLPDSTTEIYLADTLGELGLFYRLCPHVVMGGSFADIGGHNPIEPAQLGCAVFCGPQMYNFIGICQDFDARDALVHVADEADLAVKTAQAIAQPAAYAATATAARDWTREKSHILDELWTLLSPMLPRAQERGAI